MIETSWKTQETDLPWNLQQEQGSQHLDFISMTMASRTACNHFLKQPQNINASLLWFDPNEKSRIFQNSQAMTIALPHCPPLTTLELGSVISLILSTANFVSCWMGSLW
jgi:hypothetical protein